MALATMEVKRTLAGFASSGQRRKLPGPLGRVVHGFAALIAIAVVYTTTIVFVDLFAMTIVFLAAMLALVFLTVGATPDSPTDRPSAIDWLFALIALAVGAYFLVESERIITRITLLHPLTGLDMIFAPALLILTLEATRRTVGMGLTTIVAIFLAYNLWGHWLPGKLSHGEISFNHFLDIMMFTTDGLFGVPIRVAATYAFLFVLFGTFLAKAGGAEFFYNFAAAVAGRRPGGPAKIAVVSSGLYRRARCGVSKASDPKLTQRPSFFSSRLIRAAISGSSSLTMSISQGLTTVSKDPSANGGRSTSPSTR